MLKTIRLELARTAEYPTGNPAHGYEFIAPLGDDGHIDPEQWRKQRAACTVHRFAPRQDDGARPPCPYAGAALGLSLR